jgi:hypothetical protein
MPHCVGASSTPCCTNFEERLMFRIVDQGPMSVTIAGPGANDLGVTFVTYKQEGRAKLSEFKGSSSGVLRF